MTRASSQAHAPRGEGASGARRVRADALATRARIVATAESLFAERGLDGTSLVEVGRAAGQRNRSAVQYHFGDRRGLIVAILEKHTPGIEVRRRSMLDELEAQGDINLRSLVEILVWPAADKLADPDGGVAFIRVNAELVGHPRHPLLSIASERPNETAERLRRLVAREIPRLPKEIWKARWLLVTGLLFHGLADWSRQATRSRATRPVFVNQLVDTIEAALEVPLSSASRAALKRR